MLDAGKICQYSLSTNTDFTSFRREISEEEAKEKASFLGAKYSG